MSSRHDGRRADEMRPLSFERHYTCYAEGSVLVSVGRTKVLCNATVTPGVHSARYAGDAADDTANNRKLVAALAGKTDRRAHYTCVLVAVKNADDPEPVIVDARWDGEIIDTPKGTGGFGYDPYFYLPDFGRTAAELTAEEKNDVSHRGRAMRLMLEELSDRWGW